MFTPKEIEIMRNEAIAYRDSVRCGFGRISEEPYNCMGCKCYNSDVQLCCPNNPDAEKEIFISKEDAEKYSMLACDFYKPAT